MTGAHKTWRRLDGHAPLLPKVILEVKFTDGLENSTKARDHQPAIAVA
jgi:hypothetical protein